MPGTRFLHIILGTLLIACCACAPAMGQARLSGPVSGYVYDAAAQGIRPMVGLPGASYLGDAVVAGLDWAAVAPGGTLALAFRQGTLYVVRGLETAEPAWTPVEGAAFQPERAAWGREGAAIAAGNRVQWLRALSGTPAAGVAVELPGEVTALAVAGGDAVAGVAGGLYLLAEEAPRLLAAVDRPVALASGPGGRDLYVADAASGQVFEAPEFRGGANLLALGSEAGEAAGLTVSAGGRLLVAGKTSRALAIYDLESRTLAARVELDFEPSCLEALNGEGLLLLKSAGQGQEPLFVLRAGPEPAVYFVPSGRGE